MLDRTGVGGDSADAAKRADGGRLDGGITSRMDADTPGADAGTPDAGALDAGALDAGAPDAGAPDAGAPDAGAPDAGRRLSCDERYGDASRYLRCSETDTECSFFVGSSGMTCRTLCERYGGACVDSFAEVGDTCMRDVTDYDCDYGHGDGICLCTHP
jgi:hypothetical protein